jgi:hypothetical protein
MCVQDHESEEAASVQRKSVRAIDEWTEDGLRLTNCERYSWETALHVGIDVSLGNM